MISNIKQEPAKDYFSNEKFDVVIFDKNINTNWLEIFENIKHSNINTIFLVIADDFSLDEVKAGFKNGIYEILKRNINKKDLKRTIVNALNRAIILKSHEKIHEFCKHLLCFKLPSDVDLVNETVLRIIETAKLSGFIEDRDMESNLRLAYTEAVINAMVHGNKSDKDKTVEINAEISHKLIKVVICDEGNGYNIGAVDNPLDSENILKSSGRGIYLIKSIADKVIFEKNGSKIVLINQKE